MQGLIDQANVAPTTALQARLLDRAQQIVIQQDVPAIPVGYGISDALRASNLMPAATHYYIHRSRKHGSLSPCPFPASSAPAPLGSLTAPRRAFRVSPELGATGRLNGLSEMLQVDRRVEIAVDHKPTRLAGEDAVGKGHLRLHGPAA